MHSSKIRIEAFLQPYIIWVFVVSCIWLGLVFDSLMTAASVWNSSNTYTHCFFVIPIAIYLIFSASDQIATKEPKFDPLFLIPLSLLLLLWFFSMAGSISVTEHFAIFAMLPVLWGLVLGRAIVRVLWFPCLFVLFSVPVGEELVPQFQAITADISIKLLELSGVPVFREGLYIQIPEGKFLVAEACSGIRFFVSTLVLGTLCAYLMFSTFWKRCLFVCFSAALPIIANAFRAYGTMIVGHLTDMKHAVGVDHLVYGWIFFAIVTGLLVWVAILFKETQEEVTDSDLNWSEAWKKKPSAGQFITLGFLLAVTLIWKQQIVDGETVPVSYDFSVFSESELVDQRRNISSFPDASDRIFVSFRNDSLKVSDTNLAIFAYSGGSREAELVSWKNRIFDPGSWSLVKQIAGKLESLNYSHMDVVSNQSEHRTLFYWYDVPGYQGGNAIKAKLQQTLNIMLGKGSQGMVFVLSVTGDQYEENALAANEWLKENSSKLLSTRSW